MSKQPAKIVLPPGYHEVQKLISAEGTPGRGLEIDKALREAKEEAERNVGRAVELYGSRIEEVGHNVILYAGFVPVLEPDHVPAMLNPRNMNDAPQRVLGQLVQDAQVGFKEGRFGMGTPVAVNALA